MEKALADEIYGIREAVRICSPSTSLSRCRATYSALMPRATGSKALASSIQTLTKQRYLKVLEALAAADLGAVAATVKARTLVLHSELDELVTSKAADALADAIVNARRAEVPDAGHLLNIDNPEAFTAELVAFMAA